MSMPNWKVALIEKQYQKKLLGPAGGVLAGPGAGGSLPNLERKNAVGTGTGNSECDSYRKIHDEEHYKSMPGWKRELLKKKGESVSWSNKGDSGDQLDGGDEQDFSNQRRSLPAQRGQGRSLPSTVGLRRTAPPRPDCPPTDTAVRATGKSSAYSPYTSTYKCQGGETDRADTPSPHNATLTATYSANQLPRSQTDTDIASLDEEFGESTASKVRNLRSMFERNERSVGAHIQRIRSASVERGGVPTLCRRNSGGGVPGRAAVGGWVNGAELVDAERRSSATPRCRTFRVGGSVSSSPSPSPSAPILEAPEGVVTKPSNTNNNLVITSVDYTELVTANHPFPPHPNSPQPYSPLPYTSASTPNPNHSFQPIDYRAMAPARPKPRCLPTVPTLTARNSYSKLECSYTRPAAVRSTADNSRTTADISKTYTNNFKTNMDNARSNSENYRTNTDNFRTNTDNSRTNMDNSRTNTDNSRTNTDNSRTNTDNFRTNTDNSKINADNSRTNTDNSRINTDNSRTNTDNSRKHLESSRPRFAGPAVNASHRTAFVGSKTSMPSSHVSYNGRLDSELIAALGKLKVMFPTFNSSPGSGSLQPRNTSQPRRVFHKPAVVAVSSQWSQGVPGESQGVPTTNNALPTMSNLSNYQISSVTLGRAISTDGASPPRGGAPTPGTHTRGTPTPSTPTPPVAHSTNSDLNTTLSQIKQTSRTFAVRPSRPAEVPRLDLAAPVSNIDDLILEPPSSSAPQIPAVVVVGGNAPTGRRPILIKGARPHKRMRIRFAESAPVYHRYPAEAAWLDESELADAIFRNSAPIAASESDDDLLDSLEGTIAVDKQPPTSGSATTGSITSGSTNGSSPSGSNQTHSDPTTTGFSSQASESFSSIHHEGTSDLLF